MFLYPRLPVRMHGRGTPRSRYLIQFLPFFRRTYARLAPAEPFYYGATYFLSFLFHISLSFYSLYSTPRTGLHKKCMGIIAQAIYYPQFRVIVVTIL